MRLRHMVTHRVKSGADTYIVQLFHKPLPNTALQIASGALRPANIILLRPFLVFVTLRQTISSCFLWIYFFAQSTIIFPSSYSIFIWGYA